MFFWKERYLRVSQSDSSPRFLDNQEKEDGGPPLRFPQSRFSPFISNIATVSAIFAIVSTLLVSAVFLALRSATSVPSTTDRSITTCGTNTSTARSLGCNFDIISFSWLPPACYDSSLTSSFLALNTWEYFPAFNSTANPVSYETVMLGESDYYVRWEHHLWHCAYMWRKLHRALARGGPVDGYVASLEHTMHCGEMLASAKEVWDRKEVNTRVTVKFPECGVERRWFPELDT